MLYGDEKRLEMARSILPSTRRKTARFELRAVKKAHRASIRQRLRKVLLDPESDMDLRGYPNHKIRHIVRDRRGADKLTHFQRWAVEVTKDIPDPESRLSKMRTYLPKGLIGEHALDHLRFMDEFRTLREWQRPYKPPSPEAMKARRKAERERQVSLLEGIVKSGWGHRLLNQYMNEAHEVVYWPNEEVKVHTPLWGWQDRTRQGQPLGPTRARVLGGIGDIEDFLRDLGTASHAPRWVTVEPYMKRSIRPTKFYYREGSQAKKATYIEEHLSQERPNPDSHPEWSQALLRFLDLWEQHWTYPNTLQEALRVKRRTLFR